MSFLSALKVQKNKLKSAETVVTNADGTRFIESRINAEENVIVKTVCSSRAYGYVVDTKPDDIPVEIVDHLYIGSQDCANDKILRKYNIKRILSIGIVIDTKHVCQKFVPCLDLPETNIQPILLESLPFVHEAIECKHNVLVHCNAGVSRTAVVAISYLMHYENMEFQKAYDLVKLKRPAIQPNAGFQKQLSGLMPGFVI